MPFDYTNDYINNYDANGEKPEDKGRKGDTVLAHLTEGELIIPAAFMDVPEFKKLINKFYTENDMDINQFIVGNKANSINPETGYPEFGWLSDTWKNIKKAVKKVVSAVTGNYDMPKAPKPPKPPTPKGKSDPAVRAARRKQEQQTKNMQGDKSTIATGPRGLMDEATTAKSKLLG